MARTHARITEAAIELHGSVGSSHTTLSAVAKRAGVERRTLHRHFPTEADLFEACSSHYFSANPGPISAAGVRSAVPGERLERVLDELYEPTEPMLRDAELVDFASDAVAPLRDYLEEAVDVPSAGLRRRPSAVRAAPAPRPTAATARRASG